MKLEEQVVSLELAKKLKEAGYPQESHCWWVKRGNGEILLFDETMVSDYMGRNDELVCCAPTVAELGEKLPYRIRGTLEDYWLKIECLKGRTWEVRYSCVRRVLNITQADTEADARAKMWLYLKEQGLLD